jgi:inosine-uridine nucleoside N-ribohydrolase
VKRVIFDTDIGIDDAMALLFLHRASHVTLEAITTVSGNASIADTTRNALYVAERFGIDAPVYRGASGPMGPALGNGFPDFVHGKNGLGDIPLSEPQRTAGSLPAAEAIIELAEANPGELSLVAVGRLTNVAKAMDLSPRLPTLLKEIVVMGGLFGYRSHRGNVSPVAEANMAGDPLAADRVLGSGAQVSLVGLDVTHETIMNEAFIDTLARTAGDAGAFIHAITRYYFNFYEGISGARECPIHDSSAVAYLLQPALYDCVSAPVRVVSEGIAMGQSIMGENAEAYVSDAWLERPSCNVCTAVDGPAVVQLYLDTLAEN